MQKNLVHEFGSGEVGKEAGDGLDFILGSTESNETGDCCAQYPCSDLHLVISRVDSVENNVSDDRSNMLESFEDDAPDPLYITSRD